MSCENCGHLSYELAGCQYELGITTSERDTLRQQLAERDAELAMLRDNNRKEAIGVNHLLSQRDKLAGLLIRARGCIDAMGWGELETDIDAALAEVRPCPESLHPAAT